MRSTALQALFVTLLLTGACSSDQPTGPGGTILVQGVKVTPQSVQLNAIGETKQLQANVAPSNATDLAVTWESSDSTIASVSSTGLVTARAVGVGVFITVTTHDGGHQSSANVQVNP
jgi:uncharacterized protein YjdB